jgi:hypothetical protein
MMVKCKVVNTQSSMLFQGPKSFNSFNMTVVVTTHSSGAQNPLTSNDRQPNKLPALASYVDRSFKLLYGF